MTKFINQTLFPFLLGSCHSAVHAPEGENRSPCCLLWLIQFCNYKHIAAVWQTKEGGKHVSTRRTNVSVHDHPHFKVCFSKKVGLPAPLPGCSDSLSLYPEGRESDNKNMSKKKIHDFLCTQNQWRACETQQQNQRVNYVQDVHLF